MRLLVGALNSRVVAAVDADGALMASVHADGDAFDLEVSATLIGSRHCTYVCLRDGDETAQ